MGKYYLLLFLFVSTLSLSAQNTGTVKGTIVDESNSETLIGVTVILPNGTGAATDIDGKYTIQVPVGSTKLKFSYVGYDDIEKTVTLTAGQTLIIDLGMGSSATQLDMVVISAGKFEQRLGDVTVSMEVLQPELIENKSTNSLETALDQIPGCQIMDGQVSIRGGSGFAFGAGSRVIMMVDGMPLLAPDANDVKWNTLPVENIEQVEVIKGASSVLFGSSALNGAINVRTRYPRDEPETKINVFHGIYDTPMRKDSMGNPSDLTKWWDGANPFFSGMNFFHSRKIDNVDLVVGGNLYTDLGYREGEYETRGRMNFSTRVRSKEVEGLSFGLNGNSNFSTGGLYILWMDADSGALRPSGGLDTASTTISYYNTVRQNYDPYVEYWTKKGDKHSLRNRFYRTANINDTEQGSIASQWYSEYQFQKNIEKRNIIITSGVVYNYNNIVADLYGDHSGLNIALFSQIDKKWERFNLSFGVRGEYFRIDTFETESTTNIRIGSDTLSLPIKPVFRAGATYQLFEETYLRTSFGQGYRFPTIAEKFVRTTVGPLNIFPNPLLEPETGWSAEIGLKQGFRISKWTGFIDVAAFMTEYQNMMEFGFGNFIPDSVAPTFVPGTEGYVIDWTGFRAANVENARISGLDFSIVGTGYIGKVKTTVLAGYTYMNPESLNTDSIYLSNLTDSVSTMLKYRFNHLAKADVQLGYKRWSVGASMRYNSFMVNIDNSFYQLTIPVNGGAIPLGDILLPGIQEYRERNDSGDLVFDSRVSFEMSESSKLAFIINNMLNREYMSRPGDIQPPRNFTVQYTLSL
jgi:outer membrane cobalamin receptor